MEDQQNGTQKVYASLDSWMDPKLRERRYDERTFPILGTVRIQSLTEREYMEHSSKPFKKDGGIDRVLAKAQQADLMIRMVVNEKGATYLSEHHIKNIRDIDAGLVDHIAEWCRQHLQIRPEDEAKNES